MKYSILHQVNYNSSAIYLKKKKKILICEIKIYWYIIWNSRRIYKISTLWWYRAPHYRQVKARRALSLFDYVPLRTRRALYNDRCTKAIIMMLSLYKVYDDNALLVLIRTSFNSVNALLVLSRLHNHYSWRVSSQRAISPFLIDFEMFAIEAAEI